MNLVPSLRRSRSQAHLQVLAVILVGGILSHCTLEETKPPETGEQAPNFSLKNLAGERVSLKGLKQNGPVLVNFWATWCAPCKAEVPLLNQVHQTYQGKGLTVVGISVEERKDMVGAFCRKNNVKYLVLLDSKGTIAKRYGIIGYPTSLLVNHEGAVLFRESGILDERMTGTLDLLLGENKPPLQSDGK